MYGIFAWVGRPNIGLAAAGPTGPVPMALHKEHFLLIGREAIHWGKKDVFFQPQSGYLVCSQAEETVGVRSFFLVLETNCISNLNPNHTLHN